MAIGEVKDKRLSEHMMEITRIKAVHEATAWNALAIDNPLKPPVARG